jgi:hypothetical protein
MSRPRQKQITLLNLDKQTTRGGDNLKITKSGVYFSPQVSKELNVIVGDFLILGKDNKTQYIAKKPAGLFGGHRILKTSKGIRLFIQINPKAYGLKTGEYRLGEWYVMQTENEQGKPVKINLAELVEV